MDEFRDQDHPLRAQAEADLARVIDQIVALTGRPTHWRGTLIVEGMAFPFYGEKRKWCGISIREDALLTPEDRWTTMIHEGVHSVSAAFSTRRLDPTNSRWEEAVAEQLQRILRDEILQALQVDLDADKLDELDAKHQYNNSIRALEVYREMTDMQVRDFYLRLLNSTATARSSMLISILRTRTERREEES